MVLQKPSVHNIRQWLVLPCEPGRRHACQSDPDVTRHGSREPSSCGELPRESPAHLSGMMTSMVFAPPANIQNNDQHIWSIGTHPYAHIEWHPYTLNKHSNNYASRNARCAMMKFNAQRAYACTCMFVFATSKCLFPHLPGNWNVYIGNTMRCVELDSQYTNVHTQIHD